MGYIEIPTEIRSDEVALKSYSLSASQYKGVNIANKNVIELRGLLDRPLKLADKGVEVGSYSYISRSPFHFIRTKGLQSDSFLPSFSPESVIPILPSSFKDYKLQKGDVLISKDSNIGEVIILDKDYPKHMISGGIYRLPLTKHKLYVFGLLKSDFFKTQLLFLVSRGTTIKHAKTLFLDCKIPLPNQENSQSVFKYVESLVEAVIRQEKTVKDKTRTINELIEKELVTNQKPENFDYKYPNIREVGGKIRLDTGTYGKKFQHIDFLIKNYSLGFSLIDPQKIRSGSTPKKRMIGHKQDLKYLWITPTSITDFGTLLNEERISCDKNNLSKNSMLLINRTSRGGLGEYVGIAMFFEVMLYGGAQHNQGIYSVSDYPDEELLFMSCFMNSRYMRTYCAGLAVGSKMKEIKASQFLDIPFPNFPNYLKSQIVTTYREIILIHENTKQIKRKIEKVARDLVAGKKIVIDPSILKTNHETLSL